jgi:hypothetical protein
MTEQQVREMTEDYVDITDSSDEEEETPADALREALVTAGITLGDGLGEASQTEQAATAAEYLENLLAAMDHDEARAVEPVTLCGLCKQVVDPSRLPPMDAVAKRGIQANWLAEQNRLDRAATVAGIARDPMERREPPTITLTTAIVDPRPRASPTQQARAPPAERPEFVDGTTGIVPLPEDVTYTTEDYDNLCVVDRATNLPLSISWGTGSISVDSTRVGQDSFLCRPRPSRFGTDRWMVVTIVGDRHRTLFWDELAASHHHATGGR